MNRLVTAFQIYVQVHKYFLWLFDSRILNQFWNSKFLVILIILLNLYSLFSLLFLLFWPNIQLDLKYLMQEVK